MMLSNFPMFQGDSTVVGLICSCVGDLICGECFVIVSS